MREITGERSTSQQKEVTCHRHEAWAEGQLDPATRMFTPDLCRCKAARVNVIWEV